MDLLDLPAVQGTLKSLLQDHSSKASILWRSAFFTVQLSHPYVTIGKTIASPCLFNLYAIMRNAGLEETQAGIKIAGRNINNLRYADDTTLMAESEEVLLMKVPLDESEKGE